MHLYDIPSTKHPKQWSPNTTQVRMIFSYLQIPFTTEWVEYPDIAPTLREMSIAPHPEGPAYTLPAIRDGDSCIMDRLAIFDHLRVQYSTPLLNLEMDKYTNAMNEYVIEVLKKKMNFIMAFALDFMTPVGRDFYMNGKEKWAKLDCIEFQHQPDIIHQTETDFKVEFETLTGIDPYIEKYGISRSELKAGRFLFSQNEPTMADFILGALVFWVEETIHNSNVPRFSYMDEWTVRWWKQMSQYTN